MSFDQFFVLIVEAFLIVFIWPNLINKNEVVHYYGMQKEDPQLPVCYRIWCWSVPVFALLLLLVLYYLRDLFKTEFVILYFFYPLASIVLGFYIGEIISNQIVTTKSDYKRTGSF